MGEVPEQQCEVLDGRYGRWLVQFAQRRLLVVTDEAQDRLRIMVIVQPYAELRTRDLLVLLAADYDRTLDAAFRLQAATCGRCICTRSAISPRISWPKGCGRSPPSWRISAGAMP